MPFFNVNMENKIDEKLLLNLKRKKIKYLVIHHLSVKQLKQICYTLIYPCMSCIMCISHAILAYGSNFSSHLHKVQIKQNHVARLIFFERESAVPLLNLLEILEITTVHNVYSQNALKFTHIKVYNLKYFVTPFVVLVMYVNSKILVSSPTKKYINHM